MGIELRNSAAVAGNGVALCEDRAGMFKIQFSFTLGANIKKSSGYGSSNGSRRSNAEGNPRR